MKWHTGKPLDLWSPHLNHSWGFFQPFNDANIGKFSITEWLSYLMVVPVFILHLHSSLFDSRRQFEKISVKFGYQHHQSTWTYFRHIFFPCLVLSWSTMRSNFDLDVFVVVFSRQRIDEAYRTYFCHTWSTLFRTFVNIVSPLSLSLHSISAPIHIESSHTRLYWLHHHKKNSIDINQSLIKLIVKFHPKFLAQFNNQLTKLHSPRF